MTGEVILSNILVSYNNYTEASLTIYSDLIFTVFSVTFQLLVNAELNVLIRDSLGVSEYPLPVEKTANLCVERDILAYPNKTFLCPSRNLSPKTNQNVAVWGLKQHTTETVSDCFIVWLRY